MQRESQIVEKVQRLRVGRPQSLYEREDVAQRESAKVFDVWYTEYEYWQDLEN